MLHTAIAITLLKFAAQTSAQELAAEDITNLQLVMRSFDRTPSASLLPHRDVENTILDKASFHHTHCKELLSQTSRIVPARWLSTSAQKYLDSLLPDMSQEDEVQDDSDEEQREDDAEQLNSSVIDLERYGYKARADLVDTDAFYEKIREEEKREREEELLAKEREAEKLEAEKQQEEEDKEQLFEIGKRAAADRRFELRRETFGQRLRRNRRMGNHGQGYDYRADELNRLRFKYGDDYWGPDATKGHLKESLAPGAKNFRKIPSKPRQRERL
eukprot:gnl/TRDRNA2_/TRDRNA2_192367_c0_seq1.p1 gnl/TRDRNA2_/TRDRNA2_192367_c0~~gnl/TRDRNA2_/TRDRNA2_192367_c0_seq1.p1  ORF type:complete len:273 (+),score=70.66 gnl/TRDRNA2_/TRDRNA2_192367_c0_seq1:84-902(+)